MLNYKHCFRNKILFVVAMFSFFIIIPFISFVSRGKVPKVSVKDYEESEEIFKLYDKSVNKIIEVSGRNLIYGTVACEMLPSFEEEALKAQAVASYTYFTRMKNERKNNKYCMEVDTLNWKYYVTKEQMKEKFKDLFDLYYSKITKLVDSVYGEYISYENEPILAVYHAISSGNTECSKDVFGGSLSYLQSIPSQGDLFAPKYMTTKSISKDEFKSIVYRKYPDIKFDDDLLKWVKTIDRTSSGMVKKINICDKYISGEDMRSLFSLRSSNFYMDFNNNKVVFHVRGYGHGVGLSQYGAEYMAKQGANYKEILAWYYKGTSLVKQKIK